MARAQQTMKDIADKHRTNRSFLVGGWVYLKLQPYSQVTVSTKLFNKLSTKYYGP